jgi:hypothetical protein
MRMLIDAPFPAEVRQKALVHAKRLLVAATGEEREAFHNALLRLDPNYAYEWAKERLCSPNPTVRRVPIFSGWDFRLQEIAVSVLGGMSQPGVTEALGRCWNIPSRQCALRLTGR